MDVLEAVRNLGAALQQDERYLRYQVAKQINDEDKALQDDIGRFNLLRMSLNTEISKEDKDNKKIEEINSEIKALYGRIMSNDNMAAYNKAKNELDAMINQVNSVITQCLNGEDPNTCEPAANCSGSCSSCAGCG